MWQSANHTYSSSSLEAVAGAQAEAEAEVGAARFARCQIRDLRAHTFRIDKQAGGQMWNCFLPRCLCPFLLLPLLLLNFPLLLLSSLPFAQFALISAAGAELSLRLPAESAIPPPSLSLSISLSASCLRPKPA